MTEQDGINLVKRIIPEVTDDEARYILWNETGWPSFYEGDPEEYFAAQIRRCRETMNL